MSTVKIFSLSQESQVLLVTCSLSPKKTVDMYAESEGVVFTGNLEKDGVTALAGNIVFPKDGKVFLEALLYQFHSAQLFAEKGE